MQSWTWDCLVRGDSLTLAIRCVAREGKNNDDGLYAYVKMQTPSLENETHFERLVLEGRQDEFRFLDCIDADFRNEILVGRKRLTTFNRFTHFFESFRSNKFDTFSQNNLMFLNPDFRCLL